MGTQRTGGLSRWLRQRPPALTLTQTDVQMSRTQTISPGLTAALSGHLQLRTVKRTGPAAGCPASGCGLSELGLPLYGEGVSRVRNHSIGRAHGHMPGTHVAGHATTWSGVLHSLPDLRGVCGTLCCGRGSSWTVGAPGPVSASSRVCKLQTRRGGLRKCTFHCPHLSNEKSLVNKPSCAPVRRAWSLHVSQVHIPAVQGHLS